MLLKIANSLRTNHQLPEKEGSENKNLAEQPSISENDEDTLNKAFNLMNQKNITNEEKNYLKRAFGLVNQTVDYSYNIFSTR